MIAVLYFTTAMTDSAFCVTGVALGAALCLQAVPTTETRADPVSRSIASFGRLSYEIYLSHMMVFWAFALLARHYPALQTPGAAAIVFLLAAMGVAYAISAAVSRFYSEPLNRAIRRRFAARLAEDTAAGKPHSLRTDQPASAH